MEKTITNYFTPGELSKLTGVSRQLLVYYDKENIFKPDLIAKNGYRYYTFYQYGLLELIVGLRKMEVPLQDIKEYLTKRDINCLKTIYQKKLDECQVNLEKIQKFRSQLLLNLEPLKHLETLRLNQVMLTEMHEIGNSEYHEISMKLSPKERIKKIAKFLLPIVNSNSVNDYLISYALDSSEFFQNNISHYYVFLHDILPKNHYTKKLYLYLYTKFDHNIVPQTVKDKIALFTSQNGLTICSRIFILPISNHLISRYENQRINKICIQVEYKNSAY